LSSFEHRDVIFLIENRIRSFQQDDSGSYEDARSKDVLDEGDSLTDVVLGNGNNGHTGAGSSFLAKIAIVLGIAAIATVISLGLKQPVLGSSLGIQFLAEGSSSSVMAAPPVGFTFKAFGYRVILPEYAPGYAHSLAPTKKKLLVFF
jgi:hypothetical protein